MKYSSSTDARWLRAVRWSGAAVFTTGMLFSIPSAMAAPPANTQIGNQAVATYLDGEGRAQTSTSNTTTTTVQQVGSFTLESNGAKRAAAGSTVYVPHTLTNTGNGQDVFTIAVADADSAAPSFGSMKLFLDADGNGQPDNSTELPTTVSVPGQNGVLRFVVAYEVPSNATSGSWPSNAATVTATAALTAIYSAGEDVKTNTDTVTLTDQASFNVTAAIGQPSILGPVAWNTPLSSGPASGSSTVYTINFNNTGGAGAPLYIELNLPAGLNYTPGTAAWSSLPGVALSDSETPDSQTGGTSSIDYRVSADGKTIKAFISNVAPNVAGTLSFNVGVAPTAPVGTTQTTLNGKFNPGACTTVPGSLDDVATACPDLGNTNPAPFTVTATYAVRFGAVDAVPGVSGTTPPDLVTLSGAVPGVQAPFTQTVYNDGNASDTFNLYLKTGTPAGYNAYPAGTTFTWFAANGQTPLLDTNGDGIVDTGPMAAGAQVNVVLKIVVPSGTAISTSANYAVEPYLVSINDGAKVDAFIAHLMQVLGGLVDLSNAPSSVVAGDAGPGPGIAPAVTLTTEIGKLAVFPLQVANAGTQAATYDLAVSQTSVFPGTLPTGWTVTFASNANCEASNTITQVLVAQGATESVWACVSTSSSASPVAGQSLYFQVKDGSSTTTVADVLRNALNLNATSKYTFTATGDNVGQAVASGSVTYSHTIANTGNQACFADGALRITPTITAGWTYAVYIDLNRDGEINVGDTLITDLSNVSVAPLDPGQDIKILVRVFAPGSAASGSAGVISLKLEDITSTNPCAYGGSDLKNTTTVIVGLLRVYKTQVKVENCDASGASGFSAASIVAKPGECVAYQVIAKNEGDAVVKDVVLVDAVPGHTNYAGGISGSAVVTQPGVQCEASSNLTGTPVALSLDGPPVATVTCGSVGNVLPAGGSVTLRFAVQVNP